MSLPPLVGHGDARHLIAQALRGGRLPQVLLISGPAGVGKQRLALWLAQLVYCRAGGLEPCGECRECHLVTELAHPDLHWFVPVPRPKAADPQKQVDEVAEVLGQMMAERREQPLYGPSEGMASHGLASVRLLQRRASLTPVEARRKLFIIGEADRLIPQESAPDAANAILKLLEEPPVDAIFVLTTTDPRRLLPTIRSRAVPLRVGRLTDLEVREFLQEQVRPPLGPKALDERVAAAAGSIGTALAEGDDAAKAYAAAEAVLVAALEGSRQRLERALTQPPWSARGDFTAMLDALAELLGDGVRNTLGQAARRPVPKVLRPRRPDALVAAIERVEAAREAAWGNTNPQLLLAVLGAELAEVLR